MFKSNRMFLCVCMSVLMGGGVLFYGVNQNWFDAKDELSLVEQREQKKQQERELAQANRPSGARVLADALSIPEERVGDVGGVLRPLRDIEFDRDKSGNDSDSKRVPSVKDFLPPGPQPGAAPTLVGNENPQVAGMVAEMRGPSAQDVADEDDNNETEAKTPGENGRVVTSWFKPEPFNRQAYDANPQVYVNKIRPARAFDPAQPGPGVTPLEAVTTPFQNILQGEQVVLKVKAEAGAPVAFYSPQTGAFVTNLLSSITVIADDQGIATATYKAGRGSMGLIDVMVASPVHSRQLQFRIKVDLPETLPGDQP